MMNQRDLKLLDCTLRDGGYVNDWKWGYHNARAIIKALVKSGVEFVEVGFLRNINEYNADISVCNTIEELNKLLPSKKGNTIFSAMAMRSNYDVSKLSPYKGEGIEMIRVTAHDYDISEGMDFARTVKEKGYKLSINPINIMGYSDEKILWIIEQVNKIQPYQFSIVDTFGSMKRRDLDRIVSLIDNNLEQNIRLALHLHENMALSCSLAQQFVDKHLNRPIAIDASLLGMGRVPGNLPIELIADYLNDYADKNYDIDYMMDAIQEYIEPLKGKAEWGYTPAYFLSAKFNLHRNYAEYYLKKGDLTNRDINHILAEFDRDKTTVFDSEYADYIYQKYKNNLIDDKEGFLYLKSELKGKEILVLAPGRNLKIKQEQINKFINNKSPIVISVNFIPEIYTVDYAFFSNGKRYWQKSDETCKIIATSNIDTDDEVIKLNYNRLSGAFLQGFNSFVMLLKLLKDLEVKNVFVAGADGFESNRENYYWDSQNTLSNLDKNYNVSVARAVKMIGLDISYITESVYEHIV